jgi:hypothetical protein
MLPVDHLVTDLEFSLFVITTVQLSQVLLLLVLRHRLTLALELLDIEL